MANSYKTRIAAIDAQIIDVQYLYQRELDREAEFTPTQRHLLASRGFKYRLDNLYAQRRVLRQFVSTAPTRAENYAVEMSRRNTEYLEACDDLERTKKVYTDTLTRTVVSGLSIDAELELKCLRREIGAKKSIVASKNRAVDNWTKKGSASLDSQVVHMLERDAQRPERVREHKQLVAEQLPTLRLEDMSGDMQEIARASAACTAANVVDAARPTPPDTYSASFALLNSQPPPDAFAFTRSDIEHTVDAMTLANIAVDVEVEPERDAEYIKFMQRLAVESEDTK